MITEERERIDTVMNAKAKIMDPLACDYYAAEAGIKTVFLYADRVKAMDAFNTALDALEESRLELDELWRWLCAVQSVIDRFALPVESLPELAERIAQRAYAVERSR